MRHKITLEFVRANGVQEWYCPFCGRRILLNVPVHGIVIIDKGDQNISHHGSIGGLTITQAAVHQ